MVSPWEARSPPATKCEFPSRLPKGSLQRDGTREMAEAICQCMNQAELKIVRIVRNQLQTISLVVFVRLTRHRLTNLLNAYLWVASA